MSLKVGIVGAAGYAGAELIRLVLGHPEFELVAITSNADAGQPLSAVYPSFTGVSDLVFTTHDAPELKSCDAVFLAVPHTAAMAQVPALLAAGVSCFDLSADYRLSDPSVFEAWYAAEHTSPELLKTRAFGLPELFCQDLETAASSHAAGRPVLVACAGCYPTATSLAAAPAVRAGWVAENGPVIVDAISGVTGAGKSCNARTHFCSADENLEAYGVGKHRHTPEIEQILGLTDRIVFTPHLALQAVLRRSHLCARARCRRAAQDGLGRRHQCCPDRPCTQQARGRAGGDGSDRQSVQGCCRSGGPVRQHRLWF